MGYRGCEPSSPASRWLRQQDFNDVDIDNDTTTPPEAMQWNQDHCDHSSRSESQFYTQCFTACPSKEPGSQTKHMTVATTIDEAIDVAPAQELRALLRMIVHSQPSCMDLAGAYLFRGTASEVPTSRKRKARHICQHCNADFEPGDIATECCIYHPGRKEAKYDTDVFEDLWSETGTPGDSQDLEMQDGFQWSCCQQPGSAVGCVWARHQATVERHQRPWAR